MTSPNKMVVIGAGLPRTGTLTTKTALDKLLGGECYHMATVLKSSGNKETDFWNKAFYETVTKEEWKAFLEGRDFRASVDYPTSFFYKEQMEAFPDAKVVLTVRSPDKWHDSVKNSIMSGSNMMMSFPTNLFLKLIGKYSGATVPAHVCRRAPDWCEYGMFGSIERGYEASEKFFNDWTAEVKRVVPPERLLIFEVKEGWEPLCKFLDLPVPDEPFPRVNDTVTMRKKFFALKTISWITIVGLPILVAMLGMYTVFK